jgi:hypothetical protein
MPWLKGPRRTTPYVLIGLLALALVAQAGLLVWTLAG